MLGTVTDLPTTFQQRNIEGEPTNNLQNRSVIASFQYFIWTIVKIVHILYHRYYYVFLYLNPQRSRFFPYNSREGGNFQLLSNPLNLNCTAHVARLTNIFREIYSQKT